MSKCEKKPSNIKEKTRTTGDVTMGRRYRVSTLITAKHHESRKAALNQMLRWGASRSRGAAREA